MTDPLRPSDVPILTLTFSVVFKEVVVVMEIPVVGHRPRRRWVQRLGVPRLIGGDEVPYPLVVLSVGGEPEGAAATDPAVRVVAGLAKNGDPLANGLSVTVVPVGRNRVNLGQELRAVSSFHQLHIMPNGLRDSSDH